MINAPNNSQLFNNHHWTSRLSSDALIAVCLFFVAITPRLFALSKFVTADEPRWVVRSLAFFGGLLSGNFADTLQTGHPGVTTMWSGTIGTMLNYWLMKPIDGSLLNFVQSLPHNYQQIDVSILPWMRFPVVLLSSLTVVALFWLLRKLDRQIALIAALLLTFHPLYLGHSQLLHHDALVSIFITVSVLVWLLVLQRWSWRLLLLAGGCTGFAILSKSTAYALMPFMGLTMVFEIFAQRISWSKGLLGGLTWSLTAVLTAFIFWPALWVGPSDVWQAIVGWVVASAEVDQVSNTLLPDFSGGIPDLGLFFYPINWALKTTPLMLIGLLAFPVWWWHSPSSALNRRWGTMLLLWIGIFSLMLTLGDKRDGRYLLPIYFALSILAACGLKIVYHHLRQRIALNYGSINLYYLVFAVLLLGTSVTYYPYYLTYYNPLIGGPTLATRLIRVGWGDGMEEAATWLNAQPNAPHLKVATIIEQSFWPFFQGQVVHHRVYQPQQADYVLNYIRQIQNGVPFPEYWDYYQARRPAYHLKIAGIDYLWLHQEAPLVTINKQSFDKDIILRAYTLGQRFATPGQPLQISLIWRVTQPPTQLVQLQLRDEQDQVWAESLPAPVIDPAGPSDVEGHYELILPPEIPRGTYQLFGKLQDASTWIAITPIQVGYAQPIEAIETPTNINYANKISLRGFNLVPPQPKMGETIELTLHWQAMQPMSLGYTTFIHVLDQDGLRIAQRDTQPGDGQWPTDTWLVDEWLVDRITISSPTDLPVGSYQILVGWYYWDTGERLLIVPEEQDVATLTHFTIQ